MEECPLLSFYENGYPVTEALLKSCPLKWLRKGPLSSQGLKIMITKCEITKSMGVQQGRERQTIAEQTVDDIARRKWRRKTTGYHVSWKALTFSILQKLLKNLVPLLTRFFKMYQSLSFYKFSLLKQILPHAPPKQHLC